MRTSILLAPMFFGLAGIVFAQQATFQTRFLTPETALVAARTAMEACRQQGYQVGVAVVDRAGLTQVFLRDRFAGPHTVEVATNKAWTAVSFRTSTLELAAQTQAGRPMSGIRGIPRMLAVGVAFSSKGVAPSMAPSESPVTLEAKPMRHARKPASRPSPTRLSPSSSFHQ